MMVRIDKYSAIKTQTANRMRKKSHTGALDAPLMEKRRFARRQETRAAESGKTKDVRGVILNFILE